MERQQQYNKELGEINQGYAKEMAAINQQYALQAGKQSHLYNQEMWDYTNYENQVKHLEAAGLNPALLYGQGGAAMRGLILVISALLLSAIILPVGFVVGIIAALDNYLFRITKSIDQLGYVVCAELFDWMLVKKGKHLEIS